MTTHSSSEGMPEAGSGAHPVPAGFHVLAALWIAAMLAFASAAPDAYHDAMQEDRATEWLTFALFLAAAAAFLVRAIPRRRVGDALVGVFCIAAAGEEISWGQRLFGFVPPDPFLTGNAQQEANLHNMVEVFGQPKWSLIAILVAYGVLAPLLVRVPFVARLAARLRFTPPAGALVPWFMVTCVLLVVYPVRFTGEWAEALAGALFLASAGARARTLLMLAAASGAFALVMEAQSARGREDPALVACARSEVRALVDDPVLLSVASARSGRMHRRIWSLARADSALAGSLARSLSGAQCDDRSPATGSRRRYQVDPWGMAYWVRATPAADSATVEVYSFGPNRRRDVDIDASDDVIESRTIPR